MNSQKDSDVQRGLFGRVAVELEVIAEDGGVGDMVALGKKVVLAVLLPAGWVRQLQENKDCRLGSDVQPIAASHATQVSAFYNDYRDADYHFAIGIGLKDDGTGSLTDSA